MLMGGGGGLKGMDPTQSLYNIYRPLTTAFLENAVFCV